MSGAGLAPPGRHRPDGSGIDRHFSEFEAPGRMDTRQNQEDLMVLIERN